jgi:hypothetical protein
MESLEPPPLTLIQKMALILELPAVFFGILIGAVVLHQNETAWMYLSPFYCCQANELNDNAPDPSTLKGKRDRDPEDLSSAP